MREGWRERFMISSHEIHPGLDLKKQSEGSMLTPHEGEGFAQYAGSLVKKPA